MFYIYNELQDVSYGPYHTEADAKAEIENTPHDERTLFVIYPLYPPSDFKLEHINK